MIKIAICDDDGKVLSNNEKRVKKYLKGTKHNIEIKTYKSGENLLYDIQEGEIFDVILADIEMPEKSGMDIAKVVKEFSPETYVIFITSHSEYAIDAFELSVFRYIPKDRIDVKLPQAIEDVVAQIETQRESVYVISTPTRYEKIPYNRILYVRSTGKYAGIITNAGITNVRKSVLKVQKELDSKDFVNVDRGCIINLFHVMSVKSTEVIMRDGVALSVSKKRMKEIRKILNAYWADKI